MRVAIFGSSEDPLTQALISEVRLAQATPVVVEFDALERGTAMRCDGPEWWFREQRVDDVDAAILRFIPAPSVPTLERDGKLHLYEDWYVAFMQARERAALYMSWLLQLEQRGVPLVNPPHAGSVHQFKPFQLEILRQIGAQVPRTLITNDPKSAAAFADAVPDVIFKPVMGGALTRRLDAQAREQLHRISASPVIFQERAPGVDVRVTMIGDEAISKVVVDAPEGSLDFRAEAAYAQGAGTYRNIEVPERVLDQCRQAMRACKLSFAGIDLRHQGEDWVFLELNSSPVYLDVERKMGHPISRALVRHVVGLAGSAPRGVSKRSRL